METIPSCDVADTGVCGICGKTAEVFDLDLLEEYRQQNLPDETIWRSLPRLRCSHVGFGQESIELVKLVAKAQALVI